MKRFRWFPTKARFDQEFENISVDDICFILDRLRIYTRSTSFDFSNRPIYQGETSASDTAGTWTVSISGITELYDGLTVKVRLNTTQGASYNTLNVNSLGAVPVWYKFGVPLVSSTTPVQQYAEVVLTYRTIASSSAITVGGTSYTRGWVMSDSLQVTYGNGLTCSNGEVSVNLAASDIPNLSWNKITSDKPTTVAGYGITDAKIQNGVITLGNASVDTADYVSLAGTQTITGSKTFTEDVVGNLSGNATTATTAQNLVSKGTSDYFYMADGSLSNGYDLLEYMVDQFSADEAGVLTSMQV